MLEGADRAADLPSASGNTKLSLSTGTFAIPSIWGIEPSGSNRNDSSELILVPGALI